MSKQLTISLKNALRHLELARDAYVAVYVPDGDAMPGDRGRWHLEAGVPASKADARVYLEKCSDPRRRICMDVFYDRSRVLWLGAGSQNNRRVIP